MLAAPVVIGSTVYLSWIGTYPGASLVSLNWSATSGVTSYVVEAGSASGLANLAVIETGSSVPGADGQCSPGTYFIRVRAKHGCGLSAPSAQVTLQVN